MKAELLDWIIYGEKVLSRNMPWMTWNLFLAFVPLGLSFWLFRQGRSDRQPQPGKRSLLWWMGLLIFVLFLPNAPYVLTDIIHLVDNIRNSQYSIWVISLLLIPQYVIFMLLGFEAYVLSLIRFGQDLRRSGNGKWIVWMETLLHALSAIGIYLGRFERFNSWDLVTQPDALLTTVLDELVAKRPLLIVAIAFFVITGLYWIMKQVTLGILLRIRSATAGMRQQSWEG